MGEPKIPWPNLFIAGVARAGTTSLWYYLGQHRDIYMSAVKEPYFFSRREMRHAPFPKTEEAYLGLFARAGAARWRGEASTAYFWDRECARRIKQASPDARIIISLRDPVARAYSGYWHAVRLAGEGRSFSQLVRRELKSIHDGEETGDPPGHVAAGFYVEGLDRYSQLFGDRLHVLFFEDLVADQEREIRKIFEFLEVDTDEARVIDVEPQNVSGAPLNAAVRRILGSHLVRAMGRTLIPESFQPRVEKLVRGGRIPELDRQTRELLEELYAPERQRLERLLGRSIPWGTPN